VTVISVQAPLTGPLESSLTESATCRMAGAISGLVVTESVDVDVHPSNRVAAKAPVAARTPRTSKAVVARRTRDRRRVVRRRWNSSRRDAPSPAARWRPATRSHLADHLWLSARRGSPRKAQPAAGAAPLVQRFVPAHSSDKRQVQLVEERSAVKWSQPANSLAFRSPSRSGNIRRLRL
jgi:hypothetical protein